MAIDFHQWLAQHLLSERGKRTALGIYPPAYGTAQRPPLDFAPTSASHMVAFATIHGGEHPDLLSDFIKKAFKKHKFVSVGGAANEDEDKPKKKKKKSKKKDK